MLLKINHLFNLILGNFEKKIYTHINSRQKYKTAECSRDHYERRDRKSLSSAVKRYDQLLRLGYRNLIKEKIVDIDVTTGNTDNIIIYNI